MRLGLSEAALVGAVGSALGIATALAIGIRSFHSATFGATPFTALVWGGGSIGVRLLIAAIALAWPAWRDAKELTVNAASVASITQDGFVGAST